MLDDKFTSLFPAGATPRTDEIILDWDDTTGDSLMNRDISLLNVLADEAEAYANTTPAQHLPSTAFAQLVDQALSAPTALDAARIWISLGIGVVGVDQFKHPVNKQRYGASDAPMTTAEQVTRAWTEQAPTEDHPGMGIAIVPGGSRLLIIDVDNSYEVDWLQTWGGARDLYFDGMTVETPGVAGKEGHTGGGHIYLVMPDGWADGYILPKKKDIWDDEGRISDDSFDDPAHFMISAFGQYNLTPPTVREGRPYRHTGSPLVVSEDLAQTLLGVLDQTAEIAQREAAAARYAQEKADRLARREAEGDSYVPDLADRIQDWEDMTTWEDILTPEAGFTYKYSDGHCKVYKWSGSNGRRSVVAHSGCEHLGGSVLAAVHSESLQGHLRSVLPADHQPAPGSRGFNMAQMCCAMQYDGDWDQFLRGEGIHRDVQSAPRLTLEDAQSRIYEALYGLEASNSTTSTPDPAQVVTAAPEGIQASSSGSRTLTKAESAYTEALQRRDEAVAALTSTQNSVGQPFAVSMAEQEVQQAEQAVNDAREQLDEAHRQEALSSLDDLSWWIANNPEEAGSLPRGSDGSVDLTEVNRMIMRDKYQQRIAPALKARVDAASAIDVDDYTQVLDEAAWTERRKNRERLELHYAGLFYKNRIHSVVAKPGVGKSWVALEGCVAAVQEGGTAVYLDMEDNGSAELEDRAMMLGMDPRHIMQGKFRVISPEDFMEPGEPGDAGKIVRNILAGWIKNPPSVVVVDSMAKVLRSLDLDPNSEPDVVSLISMFTPLRKTEKCCIIFVDHVGHAAIGRPSGSQHKIGQVDFTFLLARKDNDAEKYPTTAMAMDVTRVKDRFTGSNVLEDPANPNYLGVISIDNVVDRSGNLQRVNIPGVALNDPDYAEVTQMDFRLIPGKKIGEKQRRDEAEEKVQKAENATAEAEQALRGILQGGEAAATPLKASLKDCGVAQEYQRSIMAAAEAGELPGVVVRQAGRSKYYSLA